MRHRIGICFGRRDLRHRAEGYLRGLPGAVHRKNGRQLAEYLGDATPHGLQRLLDPARWDADAVRDELIRYAREHLPAENEAGVLIVYETGFLKKDDKSAGVQRQYPGTAGRIENCRIAVFPALLGSRGRALIDRAFYLPKCWCDDPVRRTGARIPAEVESTTKPQLAMQVLRNAFEAGARPRWVLADNLRFGQQIQAFSRSPRPAVCVGRELPTTAVDTDAPVTRGCHCRERSQRNLETWFRLSVGEGSKGYRVYTGRPGNCRDRPNMGWCGCCRRTECCKSRYHPRQPRHAGGGRKHR